jgi:hypothetical protein
MMTRIGLPAVAALATLLTGCGSEPVMKADPVAVTGTVATANGQPVDGVVIEFFVMTPGGTPAQFPVTKGAFSGEMVPGKYSYFFSQGKSAAGWKAVPDKYKDNNADHIVEVKAAGDKITITLN